MIELGSLVRAQRVFDREFVKTQFVGKFVQLRFGWGAEVDPHHRVRLSEKLRYVCNGKPLGLEHAISIDPGVRVVHRSLCVAGLGAYPPLDVGW